tara:strand:+ start:12423 stop:12725 length:303 start_codon:yes stop_codon:yes gene_type:complete
MPESKDPKHYQKSIQTADAIMSQLSDEESIGYLRGAALKHLCRFGAKHGITVDSAIMDCEKADWYNRKLIDFLKNLKKEKAKFQHTPADNITNIFKGSDD